MSSIRITLCTWCFYIASGSQVLRITAETYSLSSPRPLSNELLQTSQFRQFPNLPTLVDQSENVQQAAVKKVQYFSIADSKLQVNRFSKRDAYKMHINAPEDEEDYDDMELAEINVFRPLFQYRLAYAKQVRNAQRRQLG